ncbi:MAG: hypothetical protein AABW80_03845 [Nanoarchaeota archaeon]
MGTAVIIMKFMPESPSSDLGKIRTIANDIMIKEGAKNISFEEKPIAFGLKSLHMKFDLDENKGTDLVESLLSNIPETSSVSLEDYRRAFG